MPSEDEDLELLLSMQEDENVVMSETPSSSPSSSVKHSSVRIGERGGFYSRNAELKLAADAEISSFSRRMAEIRSISAAKTKEAYSSRPVVTKHARSSTLQTTDPIDTLGYCSDEETWKTKKAVSMSAFKEIVKDTLETEKNKLLCAHPQQASEQGLSISRIDVELFSGLKIKDRLLPPAEIYQKLEDLRFIRVPAIKMANECGKFSGSWATVAILVDKGQPRQTASKKNFVIWKLGTLDTVVSLFLFGDAYKAHWKEQPGSILACFNANVRADPKTKEPTLSVFHCDQIIKLGTSVNFAICNGTRKDGNRCTMAIDKHVHGQYCQYHIGAQQTKYKTKRPELNGGKISIVGPGYERGQVKRKQLGSPEKENNLSRPLKIVTTSQLKSMLSEDKLATKTYYQGKRFLETMAHRAIGMKNSTGVGVVKDATPRPMKTEKRAPLAETPKNVSTLKAEPTTSARREKTQTEKNVTGLKTQHVTTGEIRIFDVERDMPDAKADSKEIEIEWSEGSEDEMVHALSRFGRLHVPLSQVL